jgi:hypothetical protein
MSKIADSGIEEQQRQMNEAPPGVVNEMDMPIPSDFAKMFDKLRARADSNAHPKPLIVISFTATITATQASHIQENVASIVDKSGWFVLVVDNVGNPGVHAYLPGTGPHTPDMLRQMADSMEAIIYTMKSEGVLTTDGVELSNQ